MIDFSKPQKFHFIGIGGISMSAIAELLFYKGNKITGSDEKKSNLTEHLTNLGMEVFYGNRASNVPNDCDVVVYTAAVHEDNLELMEAKKRNLPIFSRAKLLGQLMRLYEDAVGVAGTHGKTTTTSMLSLIQMEAGFDPTILVGGELSDIKGNLRIGKSSHMVLEACEYTNSFLQFFPKHAIVLNIEEDHLDFFRDLEDIRASFRRFCELLPEGGKLVINASIENLSKLTKGLSCEAITFALSDTDEISKADYVATSITYDAFAHPSFSIYYKNQLLGNVTLSVCGRHNVENAMAAFSMGHALGASVEDCCRALAKFRGVKRRFEYKGTLGGITIFDDYAHHPAEINATLAMAKSFENHRVVCIFQPHTYTRTRALLGEFVDSLCLADVVVLPDIYPAREEDPGDISSRDLERLLKKKGKEVYYFPSFGEIEDFLLQNAKDRDLLITMGAGDVVNIGEFLLGI